MFCHFIISIGITLIITESTLFQKFRDLVGNFSKFLGELVSCPMCLGLWVGLFYGLFSGENILFLAFGTSMFSWVISAIVSLLVVMSYYYDSFDNGDGFE